MKTNIKKITAFVMALAMILVCAPFIGVDSSQASAASALYWPVPGHTTLSQGYHDGSAIDISDGSISGANVVAAIGGKVTHKFTCTQNHNGSFGDCGGFGTGIVIAGTDGRIYQYAHMQGGSIPSGVNVGSTVSAGQVIGKVGNTGYSTGAHLHFGISIGSYDNQSGINPKNETYIYSTKKLYWPVPGHTTLSQGFHDGTSISIGDSSISGANVIAAIGGKVTHKFSCNKNHDGTFECSNNCNGFGTGLVIEGTDGRIYQYAHLQYGSIPSGIKVGSTVSDAQVIGKVGNTGYITGNALEFGITVGNYYTPSGYDPSKESYIYTEAEKKLTVTYNINGGYIDSTEYKAVDNIVYKSDGTKINHVWTYNKPQTYGLWDAATFGLKKDGYTFIGWGTKSTGHDGKIFDDKNKALLPTDINPNVANGNCSATLYALWKSDAYECIDSVIDTNTGHEYTYFKATVSWSDAKDYSEEHGGYLATITSKRENDLIASLLESDSRVWLGGSDASKEGTWTWVTGEAFNYSNWADSEPSNSSDCEHYMEYRVEKSGWNDAPDYSGNNTGFIVETELEECIITLDPNGGNGGSDYINKWESESVTFSEVPTRENYTFLGWSTNKNATIPDYRQDDIYLVYSSVTFYAVWQADHVCSYDYFANYTAEHPHYAVYRCTCGETQIDYSLTSKVNNCTECNPTTHKCNFDEFESYQDEHPHYAVYRCTCGRAEINYNITSTDTVNCIICKHTYMGHNTITGYDPTCPICNPNPNPNPVINVIIRTPSTTTISYGDKITLHADIEGTLPDGAKIVWDTPSNNNFDYSVSSDGKTCKITPAENGNTTFTAKVIAADGKTVLAEDTQEMTSKADFFQKLIGIIKKLLGLTKDIPQVFKAIS